MHEEETVNPRFNDGLTKSAFTAELSEGAGKAAVPSYRHVVTPEVDYVSQKVFTSREDAARTNHI